MFPKTRSWGIFVFRGFNFYAELGIFALRFRVMYLYDIILKGDKLLDLYYKGYLGYR